MLQIQSLRPYYKRCIRLAAPIALSSIGATIVQFADTVMVGQLGTVELAAVTFSSSVFMIGFLFSFALLMGATPLVGMAYATNSKSRIISLFQNTFLLALFSGLAMTFLLYIVYLLLPYMGQDSAIMPFARPYFLLMIASVIPYLFFGVQKQLLEGMGNTLTAMLITLASNVVNIAFNYVLIFGKFGFPEWGVFGAGISTLIARILMPITFFIYISWSKKWRFYILVFRRRYFDLKVVTEIFKIGFPIALHIVMEVSAFALSAIMLGWVSIQAVAAHQIASNLSTLSYTVTMGIAAATTVMVSHHYGKKEWHELRLVAKACYHLSFLNNCIAFILFVTFCREIASWYTQDPIVIEMGAQVIIMAALFQFSDGVQAVYAGVMRGITDVKITILYAAIAYLIVNLPLGAFCCFVLDLGAMGAWIGLIGGLSVAAILFRLRFLKQMRRLELQTMS